MGDQREGFWDGTRYGMPIHAVLQYPSLLLLVGVGGLGLVLLAPELCVPLFYQQRCVVDVERLGIVLTIAALVAYVLVRYLRDRRA